MTERQQSWRSSLCRRRGPYQPPASGVASSSPRPDLRRRLRTGVELGLDDLARWWGCWWPNRALDRAGPYRRVTAALVMLPLPLVVLAAATGSHHPLPAGYLILHLVVAASCLWLAADLIRSATISHGARPRPSVIVLAAGAVALLAARPADLDPRLGFGPVGLVALGLGLLIGAVVLNTAGEHRADPFLTVTGRWSMVGGTLVIGATGLGQAGRAVAAGPGSAAGLAGLAVVLLSLASFEARVLLRGMALLRAPAQR